MVVNVSNIPEYEYRRLLSQYSFDTFPRSFGNPNQSFVYDWNDLYQKTILNNGKNCCFISHNGWGMLKKVNEKVLPVQIQYDTLFFDFDDEKNKKPENAQLDTIKLVDFLEQYKLPYIVQFSGSKGFHVFLYFRKRLFEYRKEDETERNMSFMIRNIFRWFKNTLKLRTLDDTVGEPKKLCRLPYTYHVNRQGELHPDRRQCVPLDRTRLNWDITRIIDYSIMPPKVLIPEVHPIVYDVIEFVDRFYVRVVTEDNNNNDNEPQLEYKSHGHIKNKELKIYMDQMEKHKPCIVSNLQTMNPDHFVRVAFALYMKRMGISKEKFSELYDALAIENKYIDYYIGEDTRKYQIDNIFDNPDYRFEPSCTTIKQKYPHLCLRGKCPRYIANFEKRKMPRPAKVGRLMRWRA